MLVKITTPDQGTRSVVIVNCWIRIRKKNKYGSETLLRCISQVISIVYCLQRVRGRSPPR